MEFVYIVKNLNFAAPYPGNLMRSIWALEDMCKAHNIRFVYLFPEKAKELDWVKEMIARNTPVYFKPSKKAYKVWKAVIRAYKPIAIHTHFWTLRDCLDIKRVKLRNRRMRIIYHHHCSYFPSKKKLRESIKRFLLRADCHIACGHFMAEKFKQYKFENPVCIENAIDFSRLDSYQELDRAKLNIRNDQPIFLMFGHDYLVKGVDIAIQAMQIFRQKQDAVLIVVVASSIESAKEKILEQFDEIPDWLILLPPRDDVASYYNVADVFLSPSRHEGFCYSLPEAAYAGCRLIFSDIGGQNHAKDIPYSLIFESESSSDLAQKMGLALSDYDSIEARSYVTRRYALSAWCQAIYNIYRDYSLHS